MVRIRKSRSGQILTSCDEYIGRRVQNATWDLPKSIWACSYKERGADPKTHIKLYEARVRSTPELISKVHTLEGKRLGCWCDTDDPDSDCHGHVLIRILEEQQLGRIKNQLNSVGLQLLNPRDVVDIRKARKWASDPVWLAHATRIDETDLFAFHPQTYFALKSRYPVAAPEFWIAVTEDQRRFYVVGEFQDTQPLGPFWNNSFVTDNAPPVLGARLMHFANMVQPHINAHPAQFQAALQRALDYHSLHRKIVRRVGRALGINMEDHDLTKSRLIQVALSYCWHWEGERNEVLFEVARGAIQAGHCELEDHHPEYEEAGNGQVDTNKLFADRLAVHLQKDDKDTIRGWGVREVFIPIEYKRLWKHFRASYAHIDLNEQAYQPALADKMWPDEYQW